MIVDGIFLPISIQLHLEKTRPWYLMTQIIIWTEEVVTQIRDLNEANSQKAEKLNRRPQEGINETRLGRLVV